MISYKSLFSQKPSSLSFVSTFEDGEKYVDTVDLKSDGLYEARGEASKRGDADYWAEKLQKFSGLIVAFYENGSGHPAVAHGFNRNYGMTIPLPFEKLLEEANGVSFPVYPFFATDARGLDEWRASLHHVHDSDKSMN